MLFVCIATAAAQQPLPPNYKTTFENKDLLVMRVHYGPQEFVPMHDHTASPTPYGYLNDSGPVKLTHEKPDNLVLTRPPTHTGAFRLAPGAIERHSVQSMSDTPSDFLRVELKTIPKDDIKAQKHFAVPTPLPPGTHAEFQDSAIRIDRIVCPEGSSCPAPPKQKNRSLLIAIRQTQVDNNCGIIPMAAGDVLWLDETMCLVNKIPGGSEFLRLTLLYPSH